MKEWIIKVRRSKFVSNLLKGIFRLVTRLPTRKKTVVFESFLGKQYSDNPKAIYLYMRKHYPDYKLYWSVERSKWHKFKKMDINAMPRFGPKWIFVMARAEYWITNSRLPLWLPKPKGTTYVQTWHGTPLKRLALDMDEVHMPGTNTKKYKRNFIKESSKWDYLISPNTYSTNIFKRAFQFDRKVIESGYPRNDILINSNNEEFILSVKKKAKLPKDKKVILYAPTWRDNEYYSVGKYKFQLQLDLDEMYQRLGNEYIILFRLHYLVAENLDISKYKGFAYDFSNYEDINELYLISDLLITDYSSVFFDYAILRRPILFYVYDIEVYRNQLRGFYFNIEKQAPGPLVKTTQELISEIEKLNNNKFALSGKFEPFYQKFCNLEDGKATEKVVKSIFN